MHCVSAVMDFVGANESTALLRAAQVSVQWRRFGVQCPAFLEFVCSNTSVRLRESTRYKGSRLELYFHARLKSARCHVDVEVVVDEYGEVYVESLSNSLRTDPPSEVSWRTRHALRGMAYRLLLWLLQHLVDTDVVELDTPTGLIVVADRNVDRPGTPKELQRDLEAHYRTFGFVSERGHSQWMNSTVGQLLAIGRSVHWPNSIAVVSA